MFKPWKHVFQINGSGLTEFISFWGKPKVNGLDDKLGSVYKRCTCVKELPNDGAYINQLIALDSINASRCNWYI